MATGDDWFDNDQPVPGRAERISRESLTDQALAESLTQLQSGETSGLLGKVNTSLSGDTHYDRGTLIAASVLAAVSILLFVAGVIYTLL